MTATTYAERLARARDQLTGQGVDALLIGPSADFRYLTGYLPPLLERLTLLVVPAKGAPRMDAWPSATSCGAPSCCASRPRCRAPGSPWRRR